jgi:hypothetical protein
VKDYVLGCERPEQVHNRGRVSLVVNKEGLGHVHLSVLEDVNCPTLDDGLVVVHTKIVTS